jgi:peptidoglycan/LPS O-acetylase OafA/YrhL
MGRSHFSGLGDGRFQLPTIVQHRGDTQFADALRAIACVSVVAHHYGSYWSASARLGEIANVPPLPEPAAAGMEFFGALGPFGVALFFVLSGFVIPQSLPRYGALGFIVARFWRIFPTYWVCLATLVAVVIVAGTLFGRVPLPFSLSVVLVHFVIGLRQFLSVHAIDPVVWTLEIELLFYLFCAIYFSIMGRIATSMIGVGILLFVAVWALSRLSKVFGPSYLEVRHLLLMFAGVALNCHFRGQLAGRSTIALVLLCSGLFVWTLRSVMDRESVACAVILFVGAYWLRALPIFQSRLLAGIATISYPLYLLHSVLGYATMRLLIEYGSSKGLAISVASAVAIALSVVVNRGVELPSQRIGRRFAVRPRNASLPNDIQPLTP